MISKRWEALKKNLKELKVTFPTYYKSWNFQISIQPFALITKSTKYLGHRDLQPPGCVYLL